MINGESQITPSFSVPLWQPLSALAAGWNLYRRRLVSYVSLGALPVVALAVTSLSEYSVRKSGALSWMQGYASLALFQFALCAVRFIAFGVLLTAWAWLAGASLLEDKPSLAEALQVGGRRGIRCGFALVLLWMLSVIYAQLLFFACRAAWEIFSPVGFCPAWLAVLFVVSCALPPLLVVVSKFLFLVPLVTFERLSSLESLASAGAHVPWRSLWWAWPLLSVFSIAAVAGIVVPSWSYAVALLATAHPALTTPSGALTTQLVAAGWLWLVGPLAVCFVTSFYFADSPRYQPGVGNS